MPTYTVETEDGERTEIVRDMADAPAIGQAVELADGRTARRVADVRRNTRLHPGRWPHVSEACGVMPEQVAEEQRKFPHHEFTPNGDMVFRNPRHMDRCLKDIGGRARKYVP